SGRRPEPRAVPLAGPAGRPRRADAPLGARQPALDGGAAGAVPGHAQALSATGRGAAAAAPPSRATAGRRGGAGVGTAPCTAEAGQRAELPAQRARALAAAAVAV